MGDTIPPASPVLRSLFNLVPADAHFPDIFLDDIFPVLSRSTWPPETRGFPCESLLQKSMVIHLWKMSRCSLLFLFIYFLLNSDVICVQGMALSMGDKINLSQKKNKTEAAK